MSDYRSAPDLAQEAYARALARFQGLSAAPTPPGWDYGAPSSRTETQQAMFHLGWVCHLIGDMGVIHHTFDSLFEKHNDYEDSANGLGRVDELHAATSRFYRLDWSAADFAISLATAIHDPDLWQRVDPELIGRNLQRLTEEGALTPMQVVYSDSLTQPYFDFTSQALDGEESFALLAKGMVVAPSKAGVEIEVRILPGDGFLGDAVAAPLRLTTDEKGRARCMVYAGSRAGSLRVEVRVVSNPWGQQLTTSKRVDLLVHPSLSGADAPTVTAPRLFSLFVVSGFVALW